jgi:hypothetical protein
MAPIRLWLHPEMSLRCARDLFTLARVAILPVAVGAFLLGAIACHDVDVSMGCRTFG